MTFRIGNEEVTFKMYNPPKRKREGDDVSYVDKLKNLLQDHDIIGKEVGSHKTPVPPWHAKWSRTTNNKESQDGGGGHYITKEYG